MSLLVRILQALFATPEYLGRQGERSIVKKLNWLDLFGYPGKGLRNLYIPKDNGETTEIDLLYITQKGIFVIESKNYSGYIFGSEANANWTSTFYAGKNWFGQNRVKKYHFYNPIWQNNTHIRYLKKIIPAEIPIFSVIVFSSHCELKQIELTSSNVVICQQNTLSRCIKKIWRSQSDALTDFQVESLYNLLLPLTRVDRTVKKVHIKNIKNRLASTELCPWCGGKLVLRTAKTGPHAGQQFYGCINYPRCKYIKNI